MWKKRKECNGCAFWKPLWAGRNYPNKACHFCIDTGQLKTVGKDDKCLSRVEKCNKRKKGSDIK